MEAVTPWPPVTRLAPCRAGSYQRIMAKLVHSTVAEPLALTLARCRRSMVAE